MFKSYPHFKSFVKSIQGFTKGRKVKLSELAEKMSHELCGAEVSTLKNLLDNQSSTKEITPTSKFTEEQLIEIGKRIHQEIFNLTNMVYSNENVMKTELKEKLSDSDYLKLSLKMLEGKPREDLVEKTPKKSKQVLLLKYSDEIILVVDGKINISNYLCEQVNENPLVKHNIDIFAAAQDFAKENNATLKTIELPVCLSNYTPNQSILDIYHKEKKVDKLLSHYEPVLKLAESMGYLTHKETIFDMLEDDKNKMFLDGIFCKAKIEDDWRELIEEDEKTNGYKDNGEDTIILSGDLNIENGIHEFEFKFRELCKAERISKNKWVIEGQDSFFVTFAS